MAVLVALLTWAAFCIAGTGFRIYDDTGYVMLTQKAFFSGHPLYDQTFTQYGPAYYAYKQILLGITRLPLSHDSTIIFTVFAWIAAALFCAGYVTRMTRSLALTAITFAVEFSILRILSYEPGHPQELCALVLGLILFGISSFRSGPRGDVVIGVVGFLIGALGMTKPNIGLFTAFAWALVLSWLSPAGAIRNVAFGASAFAAVLLPLVLMRHNLSFIPGYCLLVTIVLLMLMGRLRSWRPEQRLSRGSIANAIIGVLFGGLVCAGYALATGSSPAGLLRGLVLQHVGFDLAFNYYPPFSFREVMVALVCVGCFWLFVSPARQRLKAPPFVQSCLKLGAAPAVMLLALFFDLDRAFVWGLPVLAVIAGLCPRQPTALFDITPRLFGITLAVLLGLWGYPVWGSQAALSFFVIPPMLIVAFSDALQYGPWDIRTGWRHSLRRICSCATVVGVLGWGYLRASQAAADYTKDPPCGFPGSTYLHMPSRQAAFYRALGRATRSHGKAFFSMPGLGSLYFWTGQEPPTILYPDHWMTLLAPDQQAKVVSDLRSTDDLCIIRWNWLVNFWVGERDISHNKVVRYIEDEFVPVETISECEILVRKQNQAAP